MNIARSSDAPKRRGGWKAEKFLKAVAGRAAFAAVRARELSILTELFSGQLLSTWHPAIENSSISTDLSSRRARRHSYISTLPHPPLDKMASHPLHSSSEILPPNPPALSPPPLPSLATPVNTPAFSTAPLAITILSPVDLLVSTTGTDEPTNKGPRSRLGDGKSGREEKGLVRGAGEAGVAANADRGERSDGRGGDRGGGRDRARIPCCHEAFPRKVDRE